MSLFGGWLWILCALQPHAAQARPATRCARGPCLVPAAEDVVLGPLDTLRELAIHTNFGLLTKDAAGNWRLACEETWGSILTSRFRIDDAGRVLAASYDGLFASDDAACTWPAATGAAAGRSTWDVVPTASGTFAIASAPTESYRLLWAEGRSLAFVDRHVFAAGLRMRHIAIAPGDPEAVYVGGFASGPLRAVVAVGDEIREPLPDGEASLRGVAPWNAQTLFFSRVGATDAPDEIWRSTDGGKTATMVLVLEGTQNVMGLAFGPDEKIFVAGGTPGLPEAMSPRGTLYRSHDGGDTWLEPRRGGPGYRCLRSRGARLYACAGDVAGGDAFAVGVSDDEGASFATVMRMSDLVGTAPCAEDTCRATTTWLCSFHGIGCGPGPDAGPADGGPSDGGAPEQTDGAATDGPGGRKDAGECPWRPAPESADASGPDGPAGDAGLDGPAPDGTADPGCGCAAGGRGAGPAALVMPALLLAGSHRRRWRRGRLVCASPTRHRVT